MILLFGLIILFSISYDDNCVILKLRISLRVHTPLLVRLIDYDAMGIDILPITVIDVGNV